MEKNKTKIKRCYWCVYLTKCQLYMGKWVCSPCLTVSKVLITQSIQKNNNIDNWYKQLYKKNKEHVLKYKGGM